jgi:hypothetical protein
MIEISSSWTRRHSQWLGRFLIIFSSHLLASFHLLVCIGTSAREISRMLSSPLPVSQHSLFSAFLLHTSPLPWAEGGPDLQRDHGECGWQLKPQEINLLLVPPLPLPACPSPVSLRWTHSVYMALGGTVLHRCGCGLRKGELECLRKGVRSHALRESGL